MNRTHKIISLLLALFLFASVFCVPVSAEEITVCETHIYDEGKVTKKSTCTEKGTKTYTCTVCGTKKTEKIAKTAHSYKLKADTKATLNKNGRGTTKVCTVCGKEKALKKAATIYKVAEIKLSSTELFYNNTVIRPTVGVFDSKGKKLVKGTDYKVTYSNEKSKKVGTYKVTVKLIGKYKGSKTLSYSIYKDVALLKNVEKVTVWKSNLSKSNVEKNHENGNYTKNVKSYTKTSMNVNRGFRVKFSNNGSNFYEVQYSKDKNFKKNVNTVTVKSSSNFAANIKKTESGTYYVRVRGYSNAKGKYSKWTSTASITVGYSCGNPTHICRTSADHKAAIAKHSVFTLDGYCSNYCKKYYGSNHNAKTVKDTCNVCHLIDKDGKVIVWGTCPSYTVKKDSNKTCQACGLPRGFGKGECYNAPWNMPDIDEYCWYCGEKFGHPCHHCKVYSHTDKSTWTQYYDGKTGKKLSKPIKNVAACGDEICEVTWY